VIKLRRLRSDEISKLRDIDRAERIRTGYKQHGTDLAKFPVNWDDGVSAFGRAIAEEAVPLLLFGEQLSICSKAEATISFCSRDATDSTEAM